MRARTLVIAAGLFVGLWAASPLGPVSAAPPGAFNVTSTACYPSVSVDIRVSMLSSSPSKANVLLISWSDGTTTTSAPEQAIPASSVETMQPSDVYHVDWLSELNASEPSTYTATATATLLWRSTNGNEKEVATDTLTEFCGIV